MQNNLPNLLITWHQHQTDVPLPRSSFHQPFGLSASTFGTKPCANVPWTTPGRATFDFSVRYFVLAFDDFTPGSREFGQELESLSEIIIRLYFSPFGAPISTKIPNIRTIWGFLRQVYGKPSWGSVGLRWISSAEMPILCSMTYSSISCKSPPIFFFRLRSLADSGCENFIHHEMWNSCRGFIFWFQNKLPVPDWPRVIFTTIATAKDARKF